MVITTKVQKPAPDVFVMTGDLTDFSSTDEYASLAEGVARLGKRGATPPAE